jgi:PAS domain-containing protein
LLEAAPDAMVIVDDTGTIRLVNAQTEALFGYRREELLGQPVELLIPGRFPEERINELAALVESSQDAILAKTLDGHITFTQRLRPRIRSNRSFGYFSVKAHRDGGASSSAFTRTGRSGNPTRVVMAISSFVPRRPKYATGI